MKILIANRSECALRVQRAAAMLGIPTVGVYAKGDEHQLHLRDVSETVCIGDAPATESYLHIDRILAAAQITNASAIHPGYGFLSESYAFAKACEDAGLLWMGPPSKSMLQLSDKSKGRAIAIHHGIPVLPGSALLEDKITLEQQATSMGYPVLLKAANGGGGKGQRVIHSAEDWEESYTMCLKETQKAYNSNQFILESFLHQPKHIEVQILAEAEKIHILGYRDCSIQKKHQKIIEESFFPSLHAIDTTSLEKNIRSMLQDIAYLGLGTIEFLYVERKWYFIEMNMRMQVEHPVTECQTGHDLILAQLQTYLKLPLNLPQSRALHAIECRINLLSFNKGNLIHEMRIPGGHNVRVDSALYAGLKITHHYDAMLAKIICYDTTRDLALRRMGIALSETMLSGIDSNIDMLQSLLADPLFLSGNHHTQMIDTA